MKNLESNKLIVDFMGIKPNMYSPDNYGWADQPYYSINEDTFEKVMKGIVSYVKYDSDWNWLMIVVEKIESIVFPNDVFYNLNILGGCQVYVVSSNMEELVDVLGETKLLSVYKACVEFIKWYNNENI